MHRQFPALRGLAIALVVLHHTIHMGTKYAQETGFPPPPGAFSALLTILTWLGIFAVPTFLFLSGGFFAYASSGKDLRTNYRIVFKTLPTVAVPYLIWSIVFYIEIMLLHGEEFSASGWIRNLIVGYPYNFIPLLVFYYLISPFLVILVRRYGWLIVLIIGLYQVALLNISRPGVFGFEYPGWMNWIALPILYNPLADWAIYFPLGLTYVMKSKETLSFLLRWKWVFAALTIGFYTLSMFHSLSIFRAPLLKYIPPLTFLLFAITLPRDSIPWVRQFELLGKRAYGIYLMNLLILDVLLYIFRSRAPGFLGYLLILLPILFAITLVLPVVLMAAVERLPKVRIYRFVFG